MKRIFTLSVLIFLCVVFLCSFVSIPADYENKDLQKCGGNVCFELAATCNENETKENIDEKLNGIFLEFQELIPEGFSSDFDCATGSEGIKNVIDYVASLVKEGIGGWRNFYMFIGIALLFCLAEILSSDMVESSASVRAASALVLSVPVLNVAVDLITDVGSSITDGSEFFAGIIPVLSSVAAIGSGGLTAGTATATMSFSLAFVSKILVKNLFPSVCLIFIASLLSSVDTGQGISALAKGIRGWFNFLIGITSLLIVATLGAQTLITAARESVAVKGAKYAISGMIPVVGGAVSGTLTMLISGVKMLSGSIGVTAVSVLLSFMSVPLIQLLFYRICMGACVILTSFSGASFGERFFTSVKGAIDCLIAVLTSSLLIFILEIVILTASLNNLL